MNKTRFQKSTPKKLRRKYSSWKSKNYYDYVFANIVLSSLGKKLP